MTRLQRIKARFLIVWDKVDILIYLLCAGIAGGFLAWGAAQHQFQSERESLSAERAQLVSRIVSVRLDDDKRCNASLDALRAEQQDRANEWRSRLSELSVQVQNANKNADNCHVTVTAAAKDAKKAAKSSAVAATKSAEAADAATAEHAQSTLIRKYSTGN